jgi:glucokinase
MNTLAIDIGGTKFAMAVFEGDTLPRRELRSTDREGGKDWMLQQILAISKDWQREIKIDRCGIGFGGPVNFASQVVALSTHVGGWSNFPLSDFVEKQLGIPTIMDNDANVGALGEAVYGANKGCDPSFYLNVSTGIGGGIIAGGNILRGADSYAGEIGHTPIRPDGPVCGCGARGCLERHCSGLWLERDYGRTAKELLQDPTFVEKYVKDLAQGLKIVIMMLNPARIAIGGGISKAGDRLFVPLRQQVRELITEWSRARIDIVPSALGGDNILWGANALARERHNKVTI